MHCGDLSSTLDDFIKISKKVLRLGEIWRSSEQYDVSRYSTRVNAPLGGCRSLYSMSSLDLAQLSAKTVFNFPPSKYGVTLRSFVY